MENDVVTIGRAAQIEDKTVWVLIKPHQVPFIVVVEQYHFLPMVVGWP